MKIINEVIKLNREEYSLLKLVDFSEIKDYVFMNDKEMTFRTTHEDADIVFSEYIDLNCFDKNYNCSKLGKKLYDLYDKLFILGNR